MGEFSPAGGRKLGLQAERAASLLFTVGCTCISVFKLLEPSGENGRTQMQCYQTEKHTSCSFRCELCNFLRVAGGRTAQCGHNHFTIALAHKGPLGT